MIFIGYNKGCKKSAIMDYCAQNGIEKVFILSPKKFSFECPFQNHEVIDWPDIIMYKYFYRLLQEINNSTLVVINECLRTQNRNDLTYNCIRHFLNQTRHQLIFQWLPMIEDMQDFMVLFDFDTRSQWKRERFHIDLLENCRLDVNPRNITLKPIFLQADEKLKADYQKEKTRLINGIGIKDPHTVPRNLYLMSGKAKMQKVEMGQHYVGRNNRFKVDTLQTYKEDKYPDNYTVFEFPHNFIDFTDFITLSQQTQLEVLTTDLKVDQWYFERYSQWTQRLNDGYANLS